MAPRNIAPRQNFAASIVNAIPQCRTFVLVFSSESNASAHVAREVSLAVKAGLAIIPFRIEAVTPTGDLGFYLEPIQWLDALTPPLKRHLAVLAERVKLMVHTGPAPVGAVAKPKRLPRTGPAHFSFDAEGQRFALSLVFTNGAVTPAHFRNQLEYFIETLNRTSTMWDPSKWQTMQSRRR